MFNAFGRGLSFVATDLPLFKEFSAQGLGITVKRNPDSFSRGLKVLSRDYAKYAEAVDEFRLKLKWEYIARQHISIYDSICNIINFKAKPVFVL